MTNNIEKWANLPDAYPKRELEIRKARIANAKEIGKLLDGKFVGFTLRPSLNHGLLPTPVYDFHEGDEVNRLGVVGRKKDASSFTDITYFGEYFQDPESTELIKITVKGNVVESEKEYLASI